MSLKSSIIKYLKNNCDNIADDLCSAFSLPVDVSSQRIEVEVTNNVDGKKYKLIICLKELEE